MRFHFFKILLAVFVLSFLVVQNTNALSVSELQRLIDQKKEEKARLDEENKKLTEAINKTEGEAKTLTSTINTLDKNAKKLGSDLKVTKNNISKTEYEIQQLEIKIADAKAKIDNSEEAIAQSLNTLSEVETTSILEHLLSGKTFTDVWDSVETLNKFNSSLRNHVEALDEAKEEFTDKQDLSKKKKVGLEDLKTNLTVQQKIVLDTQKAKAQLLTETKNKEAIYQKQLQANLERGRQIEQEQFEFESALQYAIDPSKIPSQKSGVLSWPITPPTITQRFGKTVDAKRLYVSGTHNGVDFRASVGTPIKSVLYGVVSAMGNTDDQKGCYSYGKWILVKHGNGLSSLYSHLSGSKVSVGQTVSTGEVIGFSGGQPGVYGSGFSTGPHLHLGLFITDALRVDFYTSSKFCKNVVVPLAPLNAYLDPLAYLPY